MTSESAVGAEANLRPYDFYKDTGVGWLPSIPETWSMQRNGRLFAQRNETGRSDLPVLEVSLRTGVRVRDFAAGDRKQAMDDRAKYKVAHAGDLAYNMMRMWQGAVGVVPVDGLVSPAYVVARVFDASAIRYFDLVFHTPAYMREVENWSRGIVPDRNRLYWEAFKQIQTPVPPPSEQEAVVRFLEHVDTKLRRYIAAKKKLIALLSEQQQAMIDRLMARGLEPNVRLKRSGVVWLGDIPEHWVASRLSQVATSFRTGPFGSALHQSEYADGGVPLVNPTHMVRGRIHKDARIAVSKEVAARLAQYLLEEHDVVFSRRGELGRCALVTAREAGWLLGTGSIRVRLNRDLIEPTYAIAMLQANWVRDFLSLSSVGSTMQNLNTTILRRVPVMLPPLTEQRRIVQHLSASTEQLDSVIGLAESQIRRMLDLRVRLFADVVTGKLDVRDVAAHLPEENDDISDLNDPLDNVIDEVTETGAEEESLSWPT